MQEGSPEKTQNSTHWNLVGLGIITSPSTLSPSCNLHPPPSHCASIRARKKIGARLLFKKLYKSETAYRLASVCVNNILTDVFVTLFSPKLCC